MKKNIETKASKSLFIAIAIIFIVAVSIIVVVKGRPAKESSDKNEVTQNNSEISFPYELEDGKLAIDSLFQYTGLNPDCGYEECEDIGSIQMTNNSGEYLKSADITVCLQDGTKFLFRVENIPAGSIVYAFDTQNQLYDMNNAIKEIYIDTEYSSNVSLLENSISVYVENTSIHLENLSGEPLDNLEVVYHCSIDDIIFGGMSYHKQIECLSPGEGKVIDAEECYLGKAVISSIHN